MFLYCHSDGSLETYDTWSDGLQQLTLLNAWQFCIHVPTWRYLTSDFTWHPIPHMDTRKPWYLHRDPLTLCSYQLADDDIPLEPIYTQYDQLRGIIDEG